MIHSHGIRPDSLSLQCLEKYRRVSTIHNNPYEDYPLKYGRFLGTYIAWKHTNGVPVCLSDISPHQEILKDSQEAGALFPVGKPETLALRLDHVISSNNRQKQTRRSSQCH